MTYPDFDPADANTYDVESIIDDHEGLITWDDARDIAENMARSYRSALDEEDDW